MERPVCTPGSWNAEHAVLRRLLERERDWKSALPVFLQHHQAVHTAGLGRGWSYFDEVLDGLNDEQMRTVPKSRHSVAWLLWHITRIEDVTMNLLLASSPQVMHSGSWGARLETEFEGVGNALSEEEAFRLGNAMDLKAFFAYRLAVGKRTRAIARRVKAERLWQAPSAGRLRRIADEGAVGPGEEWLLEYWALHPAYNLLLMPATRHPFVHLNEISRMHSRLMRPGRLNRTGREGGR